MLHSRLALIGWMLALVVSSAPVARAGSSNSLMDISTDGRLLACSNRDSGTVTIVDLESMRAVREIPVGHKPEGVTFLGPTHKVAVAVYADDVVRLLDADTGDVTGTVEVFDEPYGVVSSADGSRLFVTLTYPGQVVEIDPQAGKITRTVDAGEFLRGVAITPDDARLFVTEYYTGAVKEIDVRTGEVVPGAWTGTKEDNLARQIVLHPARPKAYVPHQRSVVTNPHGAGAIFPYVAVLDTDDHEQHRRKRVQTDGLRGVYVTANPWEVAVAPNGKTLYVVFAGTNDLFACRVLDDDYRELEYDALLQVGSNPRAVRLSPDGLKLFVYNALDFNVVVYETVTFQQIATIPVCESPLDEEMLNGKKLFYLAKQPMSVQRWISCSSCHPDGDSDGRTWQQPEGLRQTQSLVGMAWTHPIHWSADRDEVQDFEHTIRSALMKGRGLIRGPVRDGLGEANSGLSRDLDCLAVYANSHAVPLSPHAKGGLSDAARRGREVFFDKTVGCAECHSGAFYTDSRPGAVASFKLHDVGTGNDDPSELMGPKYDTPTLLGVYRTAPYLHHGRATTLREVLTTYNPDDKHGKTSHLTSEQLDDLVEYLKALPYEDPVPQAEKEGLQQVRK